MAKPSVPPWVTITIAIVMAVVALGSLGISFLHHVNENIDRAEARVNNTITGLEKRISDLEASNRSLVAQENEVCHDLSDILGTSCTKNGGTYDFNRRACTYANGVTVRQHTNCP